MKPLILTIGVAALLVNATGCSTHPVQRDSQTDSAIADEVSHAQSTQVEISYVLGHNQRRFTSQSSAQKAEVTTYTGKDIVQQANVDTAKYLAFVTKVVSFAQKPHRTPAQSGECRSPFSLTVKIDEKTYTSDGCRFSDEGGLSRLVRDGEFLLYSKN